MNQEASQGGKASVGNAFTLSSLLNYSVDSWRQTSVSTVTCDILHV